MRERTRASQSQFELCAVVPDPATGKYCPPTAQHASREGKVIAQNIIARVSERRKHRSALKTLGALAAIGRRTGVPHILGINFSGFLAWFLWSGISWSKLPRTEKNSARRIFIGNWTTIWSRGENCLAIPMSGARLEVHPFFREHTHCSVCELMPPLATPRVSSIDSAFFCRLVITRIR